MKKAICCLAVLTALSSAQAFAHKEGDFIVRAGAAMVSPNESSGNIAGVPGTEFGVDSNTQLGLTIGYMLTDNISVELLAATPFQHKISSNLTGVDGDIGEIKHLPPTLMLQYYFGEANSKLRPYVGAGLNYTFFFDEEVVGKGVGTVSNLSLDDSFGLAANVGIDYMINDNWFINTSVWYADIDTEASYDVGATRVTTDVDIDPWVFMIAGGYKF
ncbi:outer membrane protein OmpW [Vibrio panuliri]|uniref:Outer membrane protein W n=1 Tax=Vibrio panuliri TaxID=1381081 RepID=A0A1Q9HJR5_9VIBR|nr:outer membrane protein OmpW [Vibrio panuliri]KAB1453934.1 outer membrane protein OmpW [Vibrio panuliri]OLQ83999.1 outer membrane protein OmpW [Vibrio panuliri]OLQ90520.1 outer membrane protein OmpW [Vibrio panuliri]